jgi:hypothetical protein
MTGALYEILCYALIGLAAPVFITLFFITAGYGRHGNGGWGPEISARTGWIVMEAVSPIAFALFFLSTSPSASGLILAVMWLGHYGYRAFIYPFRMRGSGKTMPLAVAVMAILFNIVNGSVNGWGIAHARHLTDAWLSNPIFLGGIILFLSGLWLNLHSDAVLRNLRKPGENDYKIPNAGAHKLVAAPNYLGELIEWIGFAIAASTLAGWAFAIFTAANLVPRARAHLLWYRKSFKEYPNKRKALIPWIW